MEIIDLIKDPDSLLYNRVLLFALLQLDSPFIEGSGPETNFPLGEILRLFLCNLNIYLIHDPFLVLTLAYL